MLRCHWHLRDAGGGESLSFEGKFLCNCVAGSMSMHKVAVLKGLNGRSKKKEEKQKDTLSGERA